MRKSNFSFLKVLSFILLIAMVLSTDFNQFAHAESDLQVVFDCDYADVGMPVTARVENAEPNVKLNYCWRINDVDVPNSNYDTYILRESDYEKNIEVIIIAQPGGLIRGSMYFSALPVVYINTDDGKEILNKVDYKKAVIKMQGNPTYNSGNCEMYNGALEIRGRGNSTWGAPKKPYKLKLDKKTDLFGFGSNKHFTLLAEMSDPALIRNQTVLEFSGKQSDDFVPESTMVVCIFNGRYDGVYTLAEHVRLGDDRVDMYDWDSTGESIASIIAKAEKFSNDDTLALMDNMFESLMWITDKYVDFKGVRYNFSNYPSINIPDITDPNQFGGVFFELGGHARPAWYESSSLGHPIMIENPENLQTNPTFFNYTKNFINAFETSIRSYDFHSYYNGTSTYYGDLFDMDALVDYFFVNEISMNNDQFRASTFFYKDIGQPARFGPPWDYHMGLGNDYLDPIYGNGRDFVTFERWGFVHFAHIYNQCKNYYKFLSRDPFFIARTYEHYQEIRPTIIEDIYKSGGWLDQHLEIMTDAGAKDHERWRNLDSVAAQASYKAAQKELKDYFTNRINWLDEQYSSMQQLHTSMGYYSISSKFKIDSIDKTSLKDNTIIIASTTDSSVQQLVFFINGRNAGTFPIDSAKSAQITVPDSLLDNNGKVNVVEVKGLNSGNSYVINSEHINKQHYKNSEYYISNSIAASNYEMFYKEMHTENKNVVINQVFGGGGKGDSSVSHSFVELLNTTDNAVDLSGWKLQYENAGDGKDGEITLNAILQPGETYFIKGRIEKQSDESFPIVKFADNDADCNLFVHDFILGNKNCLINLCNDKNEIIDAFGRGMYLTSESQGMFSVNEANKHTIYARTNGIDTNSSADFTSYYFNENSEVVFADYKAAGMMPARPYSKPNTDPVGSVVINQVFGGGGKSDSRVSHSFIELLNPTDMAIDLRGWKIAYENAGDGNDGTILLNTILQPNGKYFIKGYKENQTDDTFPLIKFTDNSNDCDLFIEDFVLGNKNCRITLYNNKDEVMDGFGRGYLSSLLSEGMFGMPDANKHTIFVRTDGIDTNSVSDFTEYNFNLPDGDALTSYMANGLLPKRASAIRQKGLVVNNGRTDPKDIGISDAIQIFRVLADKIELDAWDTWAADINWNCQVEINDAILIFRLLANKIEYTDLPAPPPNYDNSNMPYFPVQG